MEERLRYMEKRLRYKEERFRYKEIHKSRHTNRVMGKWNTFTDIQVM